MNRGRVWITVTVLAGFIGLLLCLLWFRQISTHTKNWQEFSGTRIDVSMPVKPFSLNGTNGKDFTQKTLQNQWTFLFFGFTQCGEVCPTTMAELGKMYRWLEQDNTQPLPNVVMVSLDPMRDNIEKLKHYVQAFDKHFLGARGSDTETQAICQQFGIGSTKTKHYDQSQDYDIDHTGTVILINPKGEIAAFFSSPLQSEKLVSDYKMMIRR